jgi:hypothetical protein
MAVTSVDIWINYIFVNLNKKLIFALCLCLPIFSFCDVNLGD